jgi:hypothetical protein
MAKMNILSQLSAAMESSNLQRQSLGQNNALGWAQLQAQQQNQQNANLINQQQFGANLQQNQQQFNATQQLAELSQRLAQQRYDQQFRESVRQWDMLNDPTGNIFDDWGEDVVMGAVGGGSSGGNYYGSDLNFPNSNFGPYYSGM